MSDDVRLVPLVGVPDIEPGDDLAALVVAALAATDMALCPGDILAIAQKAVSKAEDRFVDLRSVTVSKEARTLAGDTAKDARLVELILRQSRRVLRHRPGLVIVEHRLGMVLANAGIDRSNVHADPEVVLLLPEDPDASAARLRTTLERATGVAPGIVVTDSVGRAWREGIVGIAIGVAGMPAVIDQRARLDRYGRPLAVTQTAFADEVAAAASLLQGAADEGRPFVLVRGLAPDAPAQTAAHLMRPEDKDLFR